MYYMYVYLVCFPDTTTPGIVSLTVRELSKIFSRNLCIAGIVLFMRSSGWNFVHMAEAFLWPHVQGLSLKFSPYMWFLALYILAILLWRARETLVKQPQANSTHSADQLMNKLHRIARPCWIKASLVLCPQYSGITKSISWLLMPRWSKEPDHQQPSYWHRSYDTTVGFLISMW